MTSPDPPDRGHDDSDEHPPGSEPPTEVHDYPEGYEPL